MPGPGLFHPSSFISHIFDLSSAPFSPSIVSVRYEYMVMFLKTNEGDREPAESQMSCVVVVGELMVAALYFRNILILARGFQPCPTSLSVFIHHLDAFCAK
jgi:hypothetical protein